MKHKIWTARTYLCVTFIDLFEVLKEYAYNIHTEYDISVVEWAADADTNMTKLKSLPV
jgi:hypothetical protein